MSSLVRAAAAAALLLSFSGTSAFAAEPCPTALRLDVDGPSTDIDPGWTGVTRDGEYVGLPIPMGVSGCAGSRQPTCRRCARSVLLKEGIDNGNAKVLVKGKGADLAKPNLFALVSPVTVQLHRCDDPVCWSATHSGPSIKQDATQYKVKAD